MLARVANPLPQSICFSPISQPISSLSFVVTQPYLELPSRSWSLRHKIRWSSMCRTCYTAVGALQCTAVSGFALYPIYALTSRPASLNVSKSCRSAGSSAMAFARRPKTVLKFIDNLRLASADREKLLQHVQAHYIAGDGPSLHSLCDQHARSDNCTGVAHSPTPSSYLTSSCKQRLPSSESVSQGRP